MNPWLRLFEKPPSLSIDSATEWFAHIADRLLNRTDLVISHLGHELVEVEFYLRCVGHEDPFAHGDPIQQSPGRWYFHRTGGSYRGGTFKGLDLTFGSESAPAGILIRTLRTPDRSLISGPSLLVDYALALCGSSSVADLEPAVNRRPAWHADSPIHLVDRPDRGGEILPCARVGMSLLRATPGSTRPAFMTLPYRFLTEPRKITKGKASMVMALHRMGRTADEICRATGCPSRVVQTYVAEYKLGLRTGSVDGYFGKPTSARDICRLHGIADRG